MGVARHGELNGKVAFPAEPHHECDATAGSASYSARVAYASYMLLFEALYVAGGLASPVKQRSKSVKPSMPVMWVGSEATP